MSSKAAGSTSTATTLRGHPQRRTREHAARGLSPKFNVRDLAALARITVAEPLPNYRAAWRMSQVKSM